MSPLETITREQDPSATMIAHALEGWLVMEVANSNENGNAYLNGQADFVTNGKAKNFSHVSRLDNFTGLFSQYPNDHNVIAKQLFCIQMGISGAFRTQCFILAKSAEDYMMRRAIGYDPLGDVSAVVTDQLAIRPLGSQTDIEDLVKNTRQINEQRFKILQAVYDDPKRSQGLHAIFHHLRLSRLQESFLRLGVDYIIHAAETSGGTFESVTFLEPKTIAKARPYQPFKS